MLSYEPLYFEDLVGLTKNDRFILKFIIKAKNYQPASKLLSSIDLKNRDLRLWFELFKERRKEENLKTGFKSLINFMQTEFLNLIKSDAKNLATRQCQILFYLYYFSDPGLAPSSTRTLKDYFVKSKQNPNSYRSQIKKIREYIFPEQISKCVLATVKTISKKFLIKLTQSRHFFLKLTITSLEMALFLGFCLNHDWEMEAPKALSSRMISTGISILKQISKGNKRDLEKIFFVWNKNSHFKIINFNANSERDNFKSLVQKSIKRKNFKFPWTFKEIQKSFIECFLVLLELVKIQHFKNASEGNFRKSNFRLALQKLQPPVPYSS